MRMPSHRLIQRRAREKSNYTTRLKLKVKVTDATHHFSSKWLIFSESTKMTLLSTMLISSRLSTPSRAAARSISCLILTGMQTTYPAFSCCFLPCVSRTCQFHLYPFFLHVGQDMNLSASGFSGSPARQTWKTILVKLLHALDQIRQLSKHYSEITIAHNCICSFILTSFTEKTDLKGQTGLNHRLPCEFCSCFVLSQF